MVIKKKLLVLLLLYFAAFYFGLADQDKLRPYRLIHADSLKARKINHAYVSELTGAVHFFYGDTEFYADKAFLYEEDKIVRMTGNVRVYDDTLSLKATRVAYFRKREKLELQENVFFKEIHADSTFRTFDANRVEYLRNSRKFTAWEDVHIFDSRENLTGTCGFMTYNADEGFGYLKEDPVLRFAGSDTLQIKSRKIEYYDDYKKIVAIFDVQTLLQDYFLTSDFLIYYSETEKATYRGSPRLTSNLFDAKASELTLFFVDNKIDKAEMDDSCRVDYKVKEFSPKQNWVTSEFMEFIFADSTLSQCRAYRNVISYYIQENNTQDNEDYIRNEAVSDKLTLFMDEKGYIDKIGIKGNIKGKYTFEDNSQK